MKESAKRIIRLSAYRYHRSSKRNKWTIKDAYQRSKRPYYKTLRIEASKNIKAVSVRRAYLNGQLEAGKNHGSPHNIGIFGLIFRKHDKNYWGLSYSVAKSRAERIAKSYE